jgi:DNA-directed RNA polymerase specialized sigma24 family protein
MFDWGALIREYRCGLYGIAWRILGHAQDAEDVVQEVFATAHQYPNGEAVKCWPALLRRVRHQQ